MNNLPISFSSVCCESPEYAVDIVNYVEEALPLEELDSQCTLQSLRDWACNSWKPSF